MSKYAIYPSLLDAYTWMQGAEDGEAYAQRKQELIDKLCRIPQPPAYAASRGTALNNLVDALIAKQGAENIGVVDCGDSHIYTVKQDGFDFAYDGALADKVADIVKGSVAQPFLSAEIETDHGTVRLYGYADYVNGAEVIDLKSTSTYTVSKYREHWQHYVYPYCLVRGGLTEDFHNFTYLVAELNAGRDGLLKGNIYTESYNPTIEECERTIRQFLDSQFLPFLEDNRAAITDGKVFGQ